MTASALETEPTLRSVRLRAHTHHLHETLDKGMMRSRPFETRERYGLFLQVQHPFLQRVESVYQSPVLNALLPGLAQRARFGLIDQDLADLGLNRESLTDRRGAFELPEALGWLYVAEGSNLGAAFLFKMAQKLGLGADFGARHLAGHPDGRALSWRTFLSDFNAVALSPCEEDRADAAAAEAFRFVQNRVTVVFG
ncbi:biliverdin-producing heme oxygenase [Microvirga antarctica]|uniref:biliverdin-producing heme oxygenase n=1 Tax=Microvirga antarctica TaxID=2819233 RepID=UPI001B305CEF|nr:biliverdin-producing heme oxygenase [Microvirga antarctica]